jgi:hypothetical protein
MVADVRCSSSPEPPVVDFSTDATRIVFPSAAAYANKQRSSMKLMTRIIQVKLGREKNV